MAFDPNKIDMNDKSPIWEVGAGARVADVPNVTLERERPYTIEEMTVDDIEPATAMRLQSWLDTYVNEQAGVTREWIEQRNKTQLSEEKIAARLDRFLENKANGTMNSWVARDDNGTIIGSTTPYIDQAGVQHLGSLYVDKNYHGSDVASQLMQRVVDWFDPTNDIVLGVVSYNERAKAFYEKWGFVEVSDSDHLFDEMIPEVTMIRKGYASCEYERRAGLAKLTED